jgi:hypothetical protein
MRYRRHTVDAHPKMYVWPDAVQTISIPVEAHGGNDFIWKTTILRVVLMCAAMSVSHAQELCVASLQQVRDSQRLVDSLHPDKPVQMRVFAPDGSELTAGQGHWIRSRLRRFLRPGPADAADAAAVLPDVRASRSPGIGPLSKRTSPPELLLMSCC